MLHAPVGVTELSMRPTMCLLFVIRHAQEQVTHSCMIATKGQTQGGKTTLTAAISRSLADCCQSANSCITQCGAWGLCSNMVTFLPFAWFPSSLFPYLAASR